MTSETRTMMDRSIFDHDHRLFREGAAAFVEKHLMPVREQIRADHGIPRELWLEAGEEGFLSFGIPEEYGGAGAGDFRFNVIWGEELTRAGAGFATTFCLHTDVVAPYLLELGTDEQKDRWLPRFCTGELITAIGMTEPEAGSDLAALRTSARADGSDWIINGSKTFITNGYNADLVIVAARTGEVERGRGITLFGLEADMPGFSRGRKLQKIGQHESDTAELFFEDVRVGPGQVIGEIGEGFIHMVERLTQERISSAYANMAHATLAVERTLEYAKDRRAFGKPIGVFQHNRFLLAELVTALDVAQAFVDRCILDHVAGRLDPVDAAKAKWWTSDLQNRVLDACVQLHGGYGYMEEYEVARAWCDARVTKIWAGSNEIMKEIIGRSLGLGERRA